MVRRTKTTDRYLVTLTCGHTLRLASPPLDRASLYACTAGARCGYSLRWTTVRSTDGTFRRTNPARTR